MKTFIDNQIERTNRNFLAANLALLAAVVGLLIFCQRYISNLILGPQRIQAQALLGVTDPSSLDRYYVSMTVDEIVPTGVKRGVTVTRYGVKESESIDSAYYILRIGDGLMLAKRPEPNTTGDTNTITGSLEPFDSKERDDLLPELERVNPDMKSHFLPFKLDAMPFAHGGNLSMVAALVLAGLLGLVNLARLATRVAKRRRHPILKHLAKLGDVDALIDEINASLPARATGRMHISPNWIAGMTEFGVDLRRTQDLVWAHATRTQHRTNGVNTGQSFAVTVYDRWGKSSQVSFGRNESAASEFIARLKATVPWAMVGYSDEVAKLWAKDRGRLISQIDQQRQRLA